LFAAVRKQFFLMIFVLPILFLLSGCVYLVVGGIGALGGYIVSPDTVEGITEHDESSVWEAAVEVLSIMGIITHQQKDAGIIKAKVNRAKVTITIIPLNQSMVKLTVKSRKAFLPRISTSQEIFVKIMTYVNE